MKNSLASIFALLLGLSVSTARADSLLLLSGPAANGTIVHLNLMVDARNVSGSYDVAATSPAQPLMTTATGRLDGRTLSLHVSDSYSQDAIADVHGRFDRPPLSHPGATFQGSLTLTGKPSVRLRLYELKFGPGTGAHIVTKSVKRHGTTKAPYSIDLEYPQIVGPGSVRYAGFNREMRAMMEKDAKGYATEDRESALPEMPDRQFSQTVTYTIAEFTDRLISVSFTLEDDSGGEHPNYGVFTINYDLQTNRDASLIQLFADHKTYLHTIAVKTIAVLAKNSDLDYNQIVTGAQTSVANYTAWNLTRWGLIFTFSPYQVGPFSAGTQQIVFPLDSLRFSPTAAALLE